MITRIGPVILAACPLFLLTGCGGGSASSSRSTPQAPSHTAYVIQTNGTTATVLEFSTSANGSVSPAASLMPPSNLTLYRVTTDSAGNIYMSGVVTGVANTGEIAIYPTGSSGNATPSRVITGSLTELTSPLSLAVDSTGQLYVADSRDNAVLIFAAGATGNVAPVRQFNTDTGFGLAVDGSGNVYTAPFPGNAGVSVYGPTATGNATPIRSITGSATTLGEILQIAVDSSGNLYVANTGSAAIDVFAAGASGNVAPTRVISGSATTLANPNGVAVDSTGVIYVCDVANVSNDTGPSVDIYASGASGNVAPQAHITSTQWTQTNDATFAIF